MRLVKKKNYKEVTRELLNAKVPSLVLFGDEDAPLRNVISDVYNAFKIFEKYSLKGEYDKFNIYDNLYTYDEACELAGKELNRLDYSLTYTLLCSVPYSKAYGVDAYEKTANLMFNIKLITSPLRSSINNAFSLQFRGYVSEEDVNKSVSDIFKLYDKDTKDVSFDYLGSNIRTTLCDLESMHLDVLYDRPTPEVEINEITFPFAKALSNYSEKMDKLVADSGNTTRRVKDRNSEESVVVRVTSASQLKRLSKRELTDPKMIEKFAKGELTVKERVSYEKNKTVFIVALDNSGSMNNALKQTHVKAIMIQLLSKVIDSEAEVILIPYTYGVDSEHTANSKETAKEVFNWVERNLPPGNGTDIAKALQHMIDKAVDTGLKEPSVTIILDGDDILDPDTIDYKGVKINAILLGRENEGVKTAVVNSGGFYILENLYEQNL